MTLFSSWLSRSFLLGPFEVPFQEPLLLMTCSVFLRVLSLSSALLSLYSGRDMSPVLTASTGMSITQSTLSQALLLALHLYIHRLLEVSVSPNGFITFTPSSPLLFIFICFNGTHFFFLEQEICVPLLFFSLSSLILMSNSPSRSLSYPLPSFIFHG